MSKILFTPPPQPQSINLVLEKTPTQGSVYVSNLAAAKDEALLTSLEIGAVLTIMIEDRCHYSSKITNAVIPINDYPNENIYKWFQYGFEFIEHWRQQTNVLLHCYAGKSRSSTILIAYIMKKYEESLEEALRICKKARIEIDPNPGFIKQLHDFERFSHMPLRLLPKSQLQSRYLALSPFTNQNTRNQHQQEYLQSIDNYEKLIDRNPYNKYGMIQNTENEQYNKYCSGYQHDHTYLTPYFLKN